MAVLSEQPGVTKAPTESSGLLAAAIRAVGGAVVSAFGAILSAFILHGLLTGIFLIAIAYLAVAGVGTTRGLAAAGLTLSLHAAMTLGVLIAALLLGIAAAIRRLGIGRQVLAAAAAKAEAMSPHAARGNDLAQLAQLMDSAFDAIASECVHATSGRWLVKRLGGRIAHFVVQRTRLAVMASLRSPPSDEHPPIETIDQWLGTRIDAAVANPIRRRGVLLLGLILGLQAALTSAAIFTARAWPTIVNPQP